MILAVKNYHGRTELNNLLLLWGQLKAGNKIGTLLLLLLSPYMAANPSSSKYSGRQDTMKHTGFRVAYSDSSKDISQTNLDPVMSKSLWSHRWFTKQSLQKPS